MSICIRASLHLCTCVTETRQGLAAGARDTDKQTPVFGRLRFLTPGLGHGHRFYPQCLCFTHLFPRTCRWVWPIWEAPCSPTTGRQTATSAGSRKTPLVGLLLFVALWNTWRHDYTWTICVTDTNSDIIQLTTRGRQNNMNTPDELL